MQNILLVGLGGAIGSIARYLAAVGVKSWFGETGFPWPTFFINVTGSMLLGFIAFAVKDRQTATWFLLATGICGGFTTFSTFSLEVVEALKDNRTEVACSYVVGSLLCGVGGFALAYYLGKFCAK